MNEKSLRELMDQINGQHSKQKLTITFGRSGDKKAVATQKKPKLNVITEKLPNAKTEDILEVMLFLMINKGIVKDVNEFVEIFESIKVADKLIEAE